MRFVYIFTILLCAQPSIANDSIRGVVPPPTIEGIGPEQQLVVVEGLRKDIRDIREDLESATAELKNEKVYYNIGNIGTYLTGLVSTASVFFLSFKSTGTFREKVKKTNFIINSKNGSCFTDLVSEVYHAKIVKYEQALRSRGRFLKFRKYIQKDIVDAVNKYRADLKIDMTLTKQEVEQKTKEFRKRKIIAWSTFIAGLTTFSGAAVLKNSTHEKTKISEKTREKLQVELEKKERDLHILEQTLTQFAN